MSTLDDLFPDAKARRDARVVLDDHHTAHRLDELLGDRRSDLDLTHHSSERSALVAMVDGAVATARPSSAAPPTPRKDGRPPHRKRDLISLGAAALAVIALVSTGVVGGIQAATASPADDALGVLTADEKTITGIEAGLTQSRTQIVDEVAAQDAKADTLRTTLESVRSAPDPADIPPGETEPPADAGTIPVADAAALDAALAAVAEYRKGLAGIEVPALGEPYRREQIDEQSLSAVAGAIDAAQRHLTALDGATADLRAVRTSVQSATDGLTAQLKSFAGTFVPASQKAVESNRDARQDLKDAVTAAAAVLASADLTTSDGAAALQNYRTALVALVSSQVYQDRVREEADREAEADRRRRQQGNPGPRPSPTPTQTPADSGSNPQPEG